MNENASSTQQATEFILDIGTRSVVGIAGRQEGELFVVDAFAVQPHTRRAMIDGQIEDIEQVAAVAGLVKNQIEEQLGQSFTRVSVAAAGRALKTCRGHAEKPLHSGTTITVQDIYNLENEAINNARMVLAEENDETAYYCVGHSAVQYLLDGHPFSTLLGHQGRHAEATVIATFLPTEVVESLRRCMDLLGLEIDTLTLEPIAAMQAVIPQDIRLLNLALVDIGAGTSDIALSADGTVSGYTMATVAGDEITEAIIRKFLVDFATAEKLKIALSRGGPFTYTDILGFDYEADPAELEATIEPAVERLAQVIADKICECNSGPPVAVFLVGGGSKTPRLAENLAQRLQLDSKRVAAANTRFSGRILNEEASLDDPEYATPVGIALIAAANARIEVATVTINGKRVRLFVPGATTIMDALLAGGYTYSSLMGRNGRSLTFTLNGQREVLRGGMYTVAEISLNGKPSSLSALAATGDSIEIIPAESGKDAAACIADYAKGQLPVEVTLNGVALCAGLVARINGTSALPDTTILDNDEVEVYSIATVGELCLSAQVITQGAVITVNGAAATPETPLAAGDMVDCTIEGRPMQQPVVLAPAPAKVAPSDTSEKESASQGPPSSKDSAPPAPQAEATDESPVPQSPSPTAPASSHPSTAGAASQPVALKKLSPVEVADSTAHTNGQPTQPALPPDNSATGSGPARSLRIQLNGKTVVLPPKPGGDAHCLFDMLTLVDIDPARPQGFVKVAINGQDAGYTQPLVNGDRVEIGWEE